MNTHAATARKHHDVMTFVVILTFVVSTLLFATYVTVHDVIPFVQHFTAQLVHPRNN